MKAAAMVVVNGDKLLVISRRDSSKFGLPAGKVEENESFLEAAIRETFEETGIKVSEATEVYRGTVHGKEVVTFLATSFDPSTPLVGNDSEGVPQWGSWGDLLGSSGAYQEYNQRVFSILSNPKLGFCDLDCGCDG